MTIADRYRRNAEAFTARVESVPADRWTAPSPCDEWNARDVVRHVVETSQMFLGRVGAEPSGTTSVDDDPVQAWGEVRDAVLSALDDPAVAQREYDGGMGPMVFEESVDRFMATDLTIHTWDLARSTGGDETLDPDESALVLEQARSMEQQFGDAMRGAGGFGPAVDIDSDATVQDRMLAFVGRDPR